MAFESVRPALIVPALSVVKRPALPECTVLGSWLATVIRPKAKLPVGGAAVIAVGSSLEHLAGTGVGAGTDQLQAGGVEVARAVGRRDREVVQQRTAGGIERDLPGIGLSVDAGAGGQESRRWWCGDRPCSRARR